MKIKPIKNNTDYQAALKRVERLWDAKPNTEASNELEVLSILIERYEAEQYAILPPDPVEAIKFRMEQLGLKQKDIAEIVGANRVSEILNRKRNLSLAMIRALHSHLNIPIESLVSQR